MSHEAVDQGRQGSQAKYRSQITGAEHCLAGSDAAFSPRLPVVRAPGISVSGGGFAARSPGRGCRGHSAGHVEASAAHRGTAAEVCQKQGADDGRDRDGLPAAVPANKEQAWLSRVAKAACSKSTLLMSLIACSSRSSPRPTRFWFPLGSALWGV